MNEAKFIGNNIRLYRERMGLNQSDLASYLEVQREVISYYETGTREVPIDQLLKLSTLFGIELYDLLEEDAEISKANAAFAFRADELGQSDLEQIASFRKIVRNYLGLVKLDKKNNG